MLTSTGRSSAQEIDQHGIIYAINLACRRGLGALCKQYYNHLLRNQLLTSDLGEDHVCIQEYDRLFAKPLDEDTIGTFLALPNSQARIASLLRDGNHRF